MIRHISRDRVHLLCGTKFTPFIGVVYSDDNGNLRFNWDNEGKKPLDIYHSSLCKRCVKRYKQQHPEPAGGDA